MNLQRRKKLTDRGIIVWWERRRLLFNLVLLAACLVSFFVGTIVIPIVYVMVVLSLNVLFTLSWIIEYSVIKRFKSETLNKRYVLCFFYGLSLYSILSIMLFLPVPGLIYWTFYPFGFH